MSLAKDWDVLFVTFASKSTKAQPSFYPADGQLLLITEINLSRGFLTNVYSPADGHFKGKAALLKHKTKTYETLNSRPVILCSVAEFLFLQTSMLEQ